MVKFGILMCFMVPVMISCAGTVSMFVYSGLHLSYYSISGLLLSALILMVYMFEI